MMADTPDPARQPYPQKQQQEQQQQQQQHSSTLQPSQITYQDIENTYQQINQLVEAAHRAEMQGDVKVAIQTYSESMVMMEQALLVQCSKLSGCTAVEQSQAKELQRKISLVAHDVTGRLEMLLNEPSHSKSQTAEPQLSPKPSSNSPTESQFFDNGLSDYDDLAANATEVFTIPNAILVFHISPEGNVESSATRQTLHVVKFDHGYRRLSNGAFIPPAFLQVGEWMYPLMPGLSPALITKYRTYVFPDILSDDEGAAVAVVFPQSVSKIERLKFEVILDYYTVLNNKHIQKEYVNALADLEIAPKVTTPITINVAKLISLAITIVATLTAWIITTAACLAVWLVQLVFAVIRSQIAPAEEPTRVDSNIRQGVIYMKTATAATVKVKQFIVDKLGEGTMMLALTIAPILKEQGEKVLPDFLASPGNEFMKGTIEITSSTIKGMTTVYKSLDYASMSVMDSVARESFNVIQHRFGEDLGTFASETLSTAQAMVRTAREARNMNLKRFAARAGKPRGKAALHAGVNSLANSLESKVTLTPGYFVKANAVLHNSTQIYVKVLERIGRSKMGLHRKSDSSSSDKEHKSYQKASIDGVLRTRRRSSYYPVLSKDRSQARRLSMPVTVEFASLDIRSIFSERNKSPPSILSMVLSMTDRASTASGSSKHTKAASDKLQIIQQAQEVIASKGKQQAAEEQNQLTRRRGSVYRN